MSRYTKIMFDIVITAHKEQNRLIETLNSIKRNIDLLPDEKIVKVYVSLDSADQVTKDIAYSNNGSYFIFEYDFKDVGLSRNATLYRGESKYVGFVDAGDVWCNDWLLKTYQQILKNDSIQDCVYHPFITFFVMKDRNEFIVHPDTRDSFNKWAVILNNPWTSSFITTRQSLNKLQFKSGATGANSKFSFEDWSWNRDSLYLGFNHVQVPETVHFCQIFESGNSSRSHRKNLRPHPSLLFEKLLRL